MASSDLYARAPYTSIISWMTVFAYAYETDILCMSVDSITGRLCSWWVNPSIPPFEWQHFNRGWNYSSAKVHINISVDPAEKSGMGNHKLQRLTGKSTRGRVSQTGWLVGPIARREVGAKQKTKATFTFSITSKANIWKGSINSHKLSRTTVSEKEQENGRKDIWQFLCMADGIYAVVGK